MLIDVVSVSAAAEYVHKNNYHLNWTYDEIYDCILDDAEEVVNGLPELKSVATGGWLVESDGEAIQVWVSPTFMTCHFKDLDSV